VTFDINTYKRIFAEKCSGGTFFSNTNVSAFIWSLGTIYLAKLERFFDEESCICKETVTVFAKKKKKFLPSKISVTHSCEMNDPGRRLSLQGSVL
jgi:hypothetical protein